MADFLLILLQPPVLIPTALVFILALVLGRWWLALVPLIGWPLFFVGLNAGWWGYGVGDGWQFALLLEMLFGLAVVAIALLLRWLVVRTTTSRRVAP